MCPYFRVTSEKNLKEWFWYFEERGTRCVIVRERGYDYPLWRLGKEATSERIRSDYAEISREIVREYLSLLTTSEL